MSSESFTMPEMPAFRDLVRLIESTVASDAT